nr:immunoglobulin light chain junction region [Macaca mulatta]
DYYCGSYRTGSAFLF